VTEVLPQDWLATVEVLRADGFDYFDWLGCVDEIGRRDCFRIVLVVRDLAQRAEPRMLNCWLPRDDPRIETVSGVFAGAAWHEREVAELFGVEFVGGERRRLLLNPGFEGTPLRKDEVLAARTGMNWPGARSLERLIFRQADATWCLLACRSLWCGVIGIHHSPLLTRRRSPSRQSPAGCGGGVRELV
jgi:NADH:ubiquinone oxidoreductase subunit C